MLSLSEQIIRKQNSCPYYATISNVKSVVTDQDHFPYTRQFRGDYTAQTPIIYSREAGWRPLNNDCYKNTNLPIITPTVPIINCFSYPCSTVRPCKNTENDCIVLYR